MILKGGDVAIGESMWVEESNAERKAFWLLRPSGVGLGVRRLPRKPQPAPEGSPDPPLSYNIPCLHPIDFLPLLPFINQPQPCLRVSLGPSSEFLQPQIVPLSLERLQPQIVPLVVKCLHPQIVSLVLECLHLQIVPPILGPLLLEMVSRHQDDPPGQTTLHFPDHLL